MGSRELEGEGAESWRGMGAVFLATGGEPRAPMEHITEYE